MAAAISPEDLRSIARRVVAAANPEGRTPPKENVDNMKGASWKVAKRTKDKVTIEFTKPLMVSTLGTVVEIRVGTVLEVPLKPSSRLWARIITPQGVIELPRKDCMPAFVVVKSSAA